MQKENVKRWCLIGHQIFCQSSIYKQYNSSAQLSSSFRGFDCLHYQADQSSWHKPPRPSLSLRQRVKHFQLDADHADQIFFPTGARSLHAKPVRSPMHLMHAVLFSIHSAHSVHSVLVMLYHAAPARFSLRRSNIVRGQTHHCFPSTGTGPNGQTFRLYSATKPLCLIGEHPKQWLRQGENQ